MLAKILSRKLIATSALFVTAAFCFGPLASGVADIEPRDCREILAQEPFIDMIRFRSARDPAPDQRNQIDTEAAGEKLLGTYCPREAILAYAETGEWTLERELYGSWSEPNYQMDAFYEFCVPVWRLAGLWRASCGAWAQFRTHENIIMEIKFGGGII